MDLDRDAQRILDLVNDARGPGADDKARVEGKLGAVLGVSVVAAASPVASTQAAQGASLSGGGVGASASAAKATGATALKWWISSALLASAVTGYVAFSSEPRPAKPPTSATVTPATALVPAMAPAQLERAVSMPVSATGDAKPARAEIVPAPAKPTRASAPKKDANGSQSEEIELLHGAQAAWRAHDAARAMTLIDEHRTRFPRSELRLERDGLRVLTLCELGRKSEATALARKLLEQAPRSPLRATIEESCALK
jgi:hypothetical protein